MVWLEFPWFTTCSMLPWTTFVLLLSLLIPAFSNYCLSSIGGQKQWPRFTDWFQLLWNLLPVPNRIPSVPFCGHIFQAPPWRHVMRKLKALTMYSKVISSRLLIHLQGFTNSTTVQSATKMIWKQWGILVSNCYDISQILTGIMILVTPRTLITRQSLWQILYFGPTRTNSVMAKQTLWLPFLFYWDVFEICIPTVIADGKS